MTVKSNRIFIFSVLVILFTMTLPFLGGAFNYGFKGEMKPKAVYSGPADAVVSGDSVYMASQADEAVSGAAAESVVSGAAADIVLLEGEASTGQNSPPPNIKNFSVGLDVGAILVDGKYVWTPELTAADHNFVFDIYYDISGEYDLEKGQFQITIPKHILKDRYGAYADDIIMSMPHENDEISEEMQSKIDWVYKEDGDNIVIYNRQKISAAKTGYIQIAYTTTMPTYEYVDMEASESFGAKLEITRGGSTNVAESEPISVYIDTDAKIKSTAKKRPAELISDWNNLWGTKPADADDYYYMVWNVETVIDTSTTQRYDFKLEDTPKIGEFEVVGYSMSGKSGNVFTSAADGGNVIENQYASGKRVDRILTRILKTHYDELPEDPTAPNGKYTVTNQVEATVTPYDRLNEATSAVSVQTYDLQKPVFVPPIGSFSISKSGGIRSYMLSKFKNKNISSIAGLTYTVKAGGYSYAYTLEDGADKNDHTKYGVNPVTFTLVDNEVYLDNDTDKLTKDDYEFSKVSIIHDIKKAIYNEPTKSFITSSADADDDVTIGYYAQFDGSDEWQLVGSYKLGAADFTNTNTTLAELTRYYNNVTITPAAGKVMTGYKAVTTNKCYSTFFTAKPEVVIKNSEAMLSRVEPESVEEIKVKNVANFNANDHNGNPIYDNTSQAYDYVNVELRTSSIKKWATKYSNDTINQRYIITWKMEMKEFINMSMGNTQTPVVQESGIFYDLLPDGSAIDLNSIQVENENDVLPESAYTIEFHHNYKDSQRTLMQVSIIEPGEKYSVCFNTNHSWENITDFSSTVKNPVAYETGNEEIAEGYPDDGGSLTEPNRTYLSNLDESTDAKKFIYSEASHDIRAIFSAASGADKKVRSELDTAYSYDAIVTPKKPNYSYRLRFSNNNNSLSGDNIIFDFMEGYENSGLNPAKSDWYGDVLSIDLSQILSKNIAAKVYYSINPTIKDTVVSAGEIDFTNTTNWQECALSGTSVDLSTVTEHIYAIAIDMSLADAGATLHKVIGSEDKFILDKGQSVFATVYMKAPSTAPDTLDAVAYNNIYVKTKRFAGIDDFTAETPAVMINQDYTTVKYRVTGDFGIEKVNYDDHEQKVRDISFRLVGKSDYGTNVDKVLTTDINGHVKFEDIERGTYTLAEYGYNPDWLMDYTQHTVKIDSLGDVYINGSLQAENVYYIIENKPRVHTDISFKKQGKNKHMPVVGAKFKLTGISDYGNDIVKYATSDNIGEVLFEDLEKGTYTMQEVEAPEGYALLNAKFTVIVDENANYSITVNDAANYGDMLNFDIKGNYTMKNEELTEFTIKKRDSWTTDGLEGAVFKLSGVSDNGTRVDMVQTTDSSHGLGTTRFSNLESGTYTLQEITAPTGYILDDTVYIVKIEDTGAVSINGLEQDEISEYFNVNNAPVKGSIVVKKIWLDSYGDDNTYRDENSLQINVSTTKPEVKTTYAQFISNKTTFYGGASNSAVKSFKRYTFPSGMTQGEKDAKIAEIKTYTDIHDRSFGDIPIYGWLDTDGTYYWYSDADIVFMHPDTTNIFRGMSNLETIDLTDIDTSKVKNFNSFFLSDVSLKEIKGVLNTESATGDMDNMFNGCSALTSLDTSGFDTSKITSMLTMFYQCNSLAALDLRSFDTQNVTNFRSMFMDCSSLKTLNVSSFNTAKAENMYQIFYNCSSLTALDISSFNTANVTTMYRMFMNCSSLTTLDVSHFDTSKVNTMEQMFTGCSGLTTIDLSNFNTANVIYMNQMFYLCSNLTKIDLSSFDTQNAENLQSMFNECKKLTDIKFGDKFTVSNATNLQKMFLWCSSLKELDLSTFDTSNVKYMNNMFERCEALVTIYASKDQFNTGSVESSSNMFYYVGKLVGGAGTSYSTMKGKDQPACWNHTYARIDKVKNSTTEGGYFTLKETTQSTASEASSVEAEALNFLGEVSVNSVPIVYEADTETTAYTDLTYMSGFFASVVSQVSEEDMADLDSLDIVDELTASDIPVVYEADTETTAEADTDDSVVIPSTDKDVTLVKDGNVWTYTFKVNEGTWYAWEEVVPEGYSTDTPKKSPAEVVDGVATITNTKDYVAPGNLTISKTVINKDGGAVINDKVDKEFKFTVTLANTSPDVSLTGTKIFGTTVFTDGVATVILKGGEEITFTDIPAGTTYTIEEVDVDANTVVTNVISVTDKYGAVTTGEAATGATASGTITTGASDKAAYTNAVEADLRDTRDVVLAKEVISTSTEEKEYVINAEFTNLFKDKNFSVVKYLADGTEDTSYVKTFTSDETGTANVSVTLKDKEKVKFVGLPIDSQYRTTEEKGPEFKSSYIVTNSTEYGTIASAKGSNVDVSMELATAWETVEAGEDVTITYTNEIVKTQSLTVSKTVAGGGSGETEESFKFTVSFEKLGAGYTIMSTIGKIIADAIGNAAVSFDIKSGESVIFSNIPVGSLFKIVEEEIGKYIPTNTTTGAGDSPGNNTSVNISQGDTIAAAVAAAQAEVDNANAVLSTKAAALANAKAAYDKNPTDDTLRAAYETAQTEYDAAKTALDTAKLVLETARGASATGGTIKLNEDAKSEFTNITPYNLVVKKKVGGVFGNKTDTFDFTASLKYKGLPLEGVCSFKKYFGTDLSEEGTINIVNGECVFSLSHNESIYLIGLPFETDFVITENGAEDYKTVNSVTAGSIIENADGKVATGQLTAEDEQVDFTNTKNGVLPTGVKLDLGMYVVIGVLALAGIIIIKRMSRLVE